MSEPLLPDSTTTRLITEPDEPQHYTVTQQTDARTALTRGLAEYASTLEIDGASGRQFIFNRAYQTWAEPEDEAAYPMAAVYAETPGDYEASKLTPALQTAVAVQAGGDPINTVYLIQPCELMLDMVLDIWATDPLMRQNLVAMMEEALNPVDWRYGMLLELPFYFNERGTYEMIRMAYIDSEDVAQQRVRRARVTVRGRVSVTRLAKAPPANFRSRLGPDLAVGEQKKPGVIRGRG